MQLTILGCSAGMPASGRASAGYLVRSQGTNVLLDAGPGVATALTKHLPATELDAIVISHLHSDHVYDLLPIGKMLVAAMTDLDLATGEVVFTQGRRIPLIVPVGPATCSSSWGTCSRCAPSRGSTGPSTWPSRSSSTRPTCASRSAA